MSSNRMEFDETDFYPNFYTDLKNAKTLVLIQSPFIAATRIELMLPHLIKCVQRGVRVCCWIRTPRESANIAEKNAASLVKQLVERLMTAGIHVTFVPDIHAKCAVIDDSIIWSGSLNILSHSNSSEEMIREINSARVLRVVRKRRFDDCTECKRNDNSLLQSHNVILTFGKMVKTARRASKLSQRKLSERMKVDQQLVSVVERGQRNITLDTLQMFCDALMLTPVFIPWFAKQSINDLIRYSTAAQSSVWKANDFDIGLMKQERRRKQRAKRKRKTSRISAHLITDRKPKR